MWQISIQRYPGYNEISNKQTPIAHGEIRGKSPKLVATAAPWLAKLVYNHNGTKVYDTCNDI